MNTTQNKNETNQGALLTAKQLQRALNICPATLSKLRRKGLPCVHIGVKRGIGTRGVRYYLPDVIAWLKAAE